jgi:phospholipid transport system substrate-binding protein
MNHIEFSFLRGADSRTRLFCVLVGILCTAAANATAAATDDEPRALLTKAVDEVLSVSNAPGSTAASIHNGVRPLFEKYFDTTLLTKRAIGPGWREFSAEQQQRAVVLFTDLALGTYVDKFKPGFHPVITYRPTVELTPSRREVPISITTEDGQPVAIAFRFESTPIGWRIYDIVIEGVSLDGNYRSQFGPIFQDGGAKGVIHALEVKAAETTAKP